MGYCYDARFILLNLSTHVSEHVHPSIRFSIFSPSFIFFLFCTAYYVIYVLSGDLASERKDDAIPFSFIPGRRLTWPALHTHTYISLHKVCSLVFRVSLKKASQKKEKKAVRQAARHFLCLVWSFPLSCFQFHSSVKPSQVSHQHQQNSSRGDWPNSYHS